MDLFLLKVIETLQYLLDNNSMTDGIGAGEMLVKSSIGPSPVFPLHQLGQLLQVGALQFAAQFAQHRGQLIIFNVVHNLSADCLKQI